MTGVAFAASRPVCKALAAAALAVWWLGQKEGYGEP